MDRQQQPYDNVLKLILDQQEATLLPRFLEEMELLEILDVEVLRPPLRVDRVYRILYRKQEHILHIEFESAANRKMAARLLVYFAAFWEKYELPVISLIVYPFEVPMVKPPLEVKSGEQALLLFHYRVLPLWKLKAQVYLDSHDVGMYGLLPTMEGANLQTLTQAIEEMQAYYQGDDTRLRRELLCFRTLLERASVVPFDEKQQIKEKLAMYNDLLEEDPYILQKKAEGEAKGRIEGEARGRIEGEARGRIEGEARGRIEGEAKGRAEGRIEGEAKGLQIAIRTVVEDKFPALMELAEQKVASTTKPDALQLVLKGVVTASDEATARLLLELLAA